jgi:ABC-type sugar transport system ATPase subunit
MLTARSLTMTYPGVKALAGVDFDLRPGEIHALCGENGAGKSTLIKILSGIIPHGRYQGTVTLAGEELRFAGPGDALRAGIRVIHQELALCPDFTVAENVFLGTEPLRHGLIDKARMESETRRELEKRGLPHLDPNALTGTLPVGIRQMIEITRALKENEGRDEKFGRRGRSESEPGQEPEGALPGVTRPRATTPRDARSPIHGGERVRVLILDEPTSALSSREAAELERTLRGLRAEGHAILYISHRLDEVFRLADRITVLRNGETRGTIPRGGSGEPFHADRIVALMVGGVGGALERSRESDTRNTESEHADSTPGLAATGATPPRVLLSVRDWTVPSPANPSRHAVDGVSFDLRAGEILGLCGLMGAGRTELVESLCGLFPARGRGSVTVDGKPYVPGDARHAHARGIALVCEDRRAHGVMPDKSVRANLTYASLRLFCSFGWLLREKPERAAAAAHIGTLRIKTPDMDFPVGNLSGGNQQKTLIARALLTAPKILILDEPTRGIDVGAKAEIHALVRALAASGMGIVLISSENSEALRLADRVLVLRDGRIAAELDPRGRAQEIEEGELLALATGSIL